MILTPQPPKDAPAQAESLEPVQLTRVRE
jgi:hypothetical protein